LYGKGENPEDGYGVTGDCQNITAADTACQPSAAKSQIAGCSTSWSSV
jgi:hypothetical protein